MSVPVKSMKHFSVIRVNQGSVLIYVLWILVVISTLAFQLTSAARVNTLNQSAVASQLKQQMQLESAIQFGMFKIASGNWNNNKFQINLNNQDINIEIYNESGFNSLYELSNKSLNNLFNSINLDPEIVEKINKLRTNDKNYVKYNSFTELLNKADIDGGILAQLIPLVSIFQEDPVNPFQSPEQVLLLLPGVDQYRVNKLSETTDEEDRKQLRNEITDLLIAQGYDVSEDLSSYYRLYITLTDKTHTVFLKYDRRQKNYKVVLVNSIRGLDDRFEAAG